MGRVFIPDYLLRSRRDLSRNEFGRISEIAKVVGIIDIFEALTTWRPYREAHRPLEALGCIKQDVTAGKLDFDIFHKFAKSVVGMSSRVFETTWH